jgi:uncharacterized coiled-coil protein SlyX
MASEAEAILPLLEQFTIGSIKPEETIAKARMLLNRVNSGINGLYAICDEKAKLEARHIELYHALCQQRQCVRQMRDNCFKLYSDANTEYQETLAPYYKAISESEAKNARIAQLELKVLQLETAIAKSESIVSARDVEIRCLNDQLKRMSLSSYKGKALMPPRSSQASGGMPPPLRRDMLAQLETPRPQRDYDF